MCSSASSPVRTATQASPNAVILAASAGTATPDILTMPASVELERRASTLVQSRSSFRVGDGTIATFA